MDLSSQVAREAKVMTKMQVIRKALEGKISWLAAADICDVSPRHMLRLRERYQRLGIPGLRDGRSGKTQPRRIPERVVEELCRLRSELYRDWSLRHFHQFATEKHHLKISYSWTRTVLQTRGLAIKAPGRGKYRRKRERRPMVGMMVHLDASTHEWVAGLPKQDLMVALDDADNRILYARFVVQEGTAATLDALRGVLTRYGRFGELYTDRGSHFCFTEKAGEPPDANVSQVSRVLRALGIRHILAWSPQARGRSERAFRTLQDRLPRELAGAGVRTYDGANDYLEQVFVPSFNRIFTKTPEQRESAFVPLPRHLDLRLLLSTQHERVVRNDNTVVFGTLLLQLPSTRERRHFVRCPVLVHEFTDQTLGVSYQGRLIAQFNRDGAALETKERAVA
jgi:transposase